MSPDDVREHLKQRVTGGPAAEFGGARGSGAAVNSKTVRAAREETIFANISASYFKLRRSLAVLAFSMPIILVAWSGTLKGSISSYYHGVTFAASEYGAGEMRDFFVGVLWAIGTFLVAYKGYSKVENRALNAAGSAAILVSLFPMDWAPGEARSAAAIVHYASAASLFLAIAYVCIWTSGDTLQIMLDQTKKRRFQKIYLALGALMILAPASVYALYELADLPDSPMIFAVEAVGIWVFSAFWFTKSREIYVLERQ